jgi:hypothetical protein
MAGVLQLTTDIHLAASLRMSEADLPLSILFQEAVLD